MRRMISGSIRSKLLTLVGLSLLGLVLLAALSAVQVRNTMRDERRATMRSVVQEAISIAAYYEAQAKAGKLSLAEAQSRAGAALRAQRFEGSGYIWIYDSKGVCVLHGTKPEREGRTSSRTRTRRATRTSLI